MPSEKIISLRFAFLFIHFCKIDTTFQNAHPYLLIKNGRPSFASTFGNVTSDQTASSKTSTFATLTNFICLFMLYLLKPEDFKQTCDTCSLKSCVDSLIV